MIRAYYLSTGPDGHSHVIRGSIVDNEVIATESILFEETPAHSSLDWHTAPTTQYVITLSGILEFTMHSGETFTINPGDVLLAEDTTGSGHKWRLINDQPWQRVYVVFKENTKINFKANERQRQSDGNCH
jgi:quercetin dioxygenase-like cupin family protein